MEMTGYIVMDNYLLNIKHQEGVTLYGLRFCSHREKMAELLGRK